MTLGDLPKEEDKDLNWPLKLFHLSPLKQKKYQMLSKLIPKNLEGLSCLDVGSDNGVISYLLREKGGSWSSTDLTQHAVDSIRELVKERVFQIEDGKIALSASSFDLIVIVDLLEHLEEDSAFIQELLRLLKDDGELIVNVPNPKEGLLRRFRFFLGQTDEQHGHVRPGYTLEELRVLLGDDFTITSSYSYSRFFSQLVDTVILAGIMVLKAGKEGKKGSVVTQESLGKRKKELKLFKLVAPFLKLAVCFDNLIPFTHGAMLIVRAARKSCKVAC